jgi:hypothetical protein
MIDDIIEFVDNEDEEGIIIVVDQQKAFDRMEWGCLNYVMECFNFGLTFREWVYMLFKRGKPCIKRIVQQIIHFCLRVACTHAYLCFPYGLLLTVG